jgi:hypothetical protein
MKLFEEVIYDKPICDGVINSITDWEIAGYYIKVNGNRDVATVLRPDKRNSLRSNIIIKKGEPTYDNLNKTFNSLGYKLVKDEILGSVLKYEEGGFLAKHCDLSDAWPNRLFCVIIQLNDSTDYEGCEMVYYMKDGDFIMNKSLGNTLIIKPDIHHEVKLLTRGVRHSMIFWLDSSEVKIISSNLI